ncbi:hypothetical protein GCM10007881_15690 [Mesorhizobium huakuii]|uniref:hypothetical protein n=1 Tax=Mesorhizobium huakuii TaxID=28104 RepID=UPI00235CA4F5|nr:hypothetical protein [Mesorhizobium huakuii]GLQ78053.1 hypothetical protein GCM10007881_15690 [Mesorhizobium huakuii]
MADRGDVEGKWLFVDDDDASAASYRDAFAEAADPLEIVVTRPSVGRELLLTGANPKGVLMDVELSGEAGEHGTGLGLAQDIRALQKSGGPEYPVIRFANILPIQRNVLGDPASDDLFDDKINKSEVGKHRDKFARRIVGTRAVYEGLLAFDKGKLEFKQLFNVDDQGIEEWLHPGLLARLEDGHSHATHIAAGAFIRSFLGPPGLLIGHHLLVTRLGIDPESAKKHWDRIASFVAGFAYTGLGHGFSPRWWARGLELAWMSLKSAENPLASTPIGERAAVLSKELDVELAGLKMPPISPGDRPWRWCQLSNEQNPPGFLPVDPRYGVRLTPRSDLAPWVDPLYASIGLALRNKDDRRLNRRDLDRLAAELR